jgi:hypothetical protein
MTFKTEQDGKNFVVKCLWHSWDLSDCIVPKYFDADDDIEEDWTTIVAILDSAVLAKQLADALDTWCFEAIKSHSEELEQTRFGKVLNQMLVELDEHQDWAARIPRIVEYIVRHREEHLKLVINKS